MSKIVRPSSRQPNQLRDINIERGYTKHAEGSVLISFGNTKVLCNASIDKGVPRFLKGQNQGWITAEYGMLPRSTHTRMGREAARGKQSGRTQEIQRLIGRSLRAAVNLKALGENTITVDCDVIQADGGTRTAAITGAWVALHDALNSHFNNSEAAVNACLSEQIAAVSVGVYQGSAVLDLDYDEDGNAQTDMNVVMNGRNGFIEVQGTAEDNSFSNDELQTMLSLAQEGITTLMEKQQASLSEAL